MQLIDLYFFITLTVLVFILNIKHRIKICKGIVEIMKPIHGWV